MSSRNNAPTQRQLRVGEMVRHALSEMLTRGDIHDDVIASHVITISEVRMSPDLKIAKAYVMPLGGDDMKPVLQALSRHRKYIRSTIGRAVALKYVPDVRFHEDDTYDEALRIDQLLGSEKVRQDLEKD